MNEVETERLNRKRQLAASFRVFARFGYAQASAARVLREENQPVTDNPLEVLSKFDGYEVTPADQADFQPGRFVSRAEKAGAGQAA